MNEVAPLYLNRSGHQLSSRRKNPAQDINDFLDPKTVERKNIFSLLSSEHLVSHLHNRPKNEPRSKGKRQKKLESLYSIRKQPKKPSHGQLCITSEKKQIIERSPDPDKKCLPRSSLTNHSPCKTFYSFKSPTAVPHLSAQQSVKIISKPSSSPFDLWKLSFNLSPDSKIFVIAGIYPDVRKALIQRGWYENPDPESPHFDLKWSRNARIPQNLIDFQLYNHFPRNFELSVKWQLYENIKRPDKSFTESYLTFFPRSFRLDTKGYNEFFEHFKVNFAISMLKSYKSSESTYATEQLIVANIVCRRFITEIDQQNFANNRLSSLVMNFEWKILTSTDLLEIKTSFSRLMLGPVPDLYSLTCTNLQDLQSKDPQFNLNGKKNIWIVKAGRKSRGRDISLFNDITSLNAFTSSPNNWVAQKYIENPLIILHKKFDIRQWVLISCCDPLTIWIYKRCYLRFSIEDYTDENISNPYVHLTNNTISKKSKKFELSSIDGCMWSNEKFKEFLIQEKGTDVWTNSIYPALKKIVRHSLVAIGNLGRNNSFEILGYDFMVDEDLKPWLLEVNSSPAMDYSTSVTEVLVKEVLEDAVKVIVDYPEGGETGGFELCYKAKYYIPVRSN